MKQFYPGTIKRSFDLFFAAVLLLLAGPLMLVLFIILLLTNHVPVFFTQLRPGYHENIFRLYKFRTMNDNRDTSGNLLPDAERLTTLGKILRKTSLDELPQLINVLVGDMSFIGPRPLLPEYLPFYNDEEKRRHHVRPGITGWAQVNGRNAISWQKKFELDVWYVDHISFLTDLKIILLTIRNIFLASGISAEGHATMPKFSDLFKKNETS